MGREKRKRERKIDKWKEKGLFEIQSGTET